MSEDGIPRVYSNLVEAQFGEEGETGQRRTTVTVRLSGLPSFKCIRIRQVLRLC